MMRNNSKPSKTVSKKKKVSTVKTPKKTSTVKTPNTVTPCKVNVIYLDNNGTTKLCKDGKDAMVTWLDSRANPSSDSIIANKSKELMICARKYMAKHCGASYSKYSFVFTSGASESNCFILRSVVDAYKKHTGKKPHIITSATEHKSIIQCCNSLKTNGNASITYIEPNAYGCISPDLVKKAITSNTALISIMAANNELGCINDIKNVGDIARSHKIPFHTDAVQLFGKYKMPMVKSNIDALSMSFHKLYGPMGLGMLVISNDLIDGYDLKGQISGTQQNELRGGTENVPAVAAAIASVKHTFTNRDSKNKKLYLQKKQILFELEKVLPQGKYKNYFAKKNPTRNEFVVMGPECNNSYKNPNVLPNTLLISFVKNVPLEGEGERYIPFCNVELKKYLNRKNIIISVGSACSTSSKKASHVLYSIKAPERIRQGVIRVSLSDNTTSAEISTFVKELISGIRKQMPLDGDKKSSKK
jgi:cysteine desulfurase